MFKKERYNGIPKKGEMRATYSIRGRHEKRKQNFGRIASKKQITSGLYSFHRHPLHLAVLDFPNCSGTL
jgi:hypothetical protein